MKKLDNKGMTLIESVAAILVIVIASTILLESFSAVTKIIGNTNTRDLATDQQLASLVGGTTNEGITLTTEQLETVIMVEGSTSPIIVTGDYVKASGIDTDVALQNFEITKKSNDMYEQMLEQARAIYEDTKNLTATQKNEYLNKLEQQAGIDTSLKCLTGIRNDELRVFYYLLYGHPTLDTDVVAECNKIFDKTHSKAGQNTKEAKAKIGTRTLYLKPYFIEKSKEYVLYGVFTEGIDTEGWRTVIIYDEVDKSLYYKTFPSNGGDIGSYYGLTSITSLLTLRGELHSNNGWERLTAK